MSGPGRSQDEGLIAVLDVGKTNAKLTVTEFDTGAETWRAERPSRARDGQLDATGIAAWLTTCLGSIPERRRLRAVVPVAHGSAAAFLDASGALLAVPDYEDPGHTAFDAEYEGLRDPFEATLSPPLPQGQNLGRQIHALARRDPALFAAVRHILPYPQYWAYVLSSVMANETTSIGAHTDLWLPREARFSPLAVSQGWDRLFPPLRSAREALGPIRPDLAASAGLDPACQVWCGIHDSNASYLSHRAHRDAPFAVVSSGTWTIVLAAGADLDRLRPERDTLANVDAFGAPVGTARFMGGREYGAIAGSDPASPTVSAVADAVTQGAMALPSFAAGGPFNGRRGRLAGSPPQDGAACASLATLYVALMTDVALDLLGAAGEVIVDGPLAANALFAPLLGALRPGAVVLTSGRQAGTLSGARWLVRGPAEPAPELRPARPASVPGLSAYRDRWRSLAETTDH
jgi:L-fuculokinase